MKSSAPQQQYQPRPSPQQPQAKDTSENTAPASKREQSTSMSQLRGRETHPTNALYVGELDWVCITMGYLVLFPNDIFIEPICLYLVG
jgi:hypothetical protein